MKESPTLADALIREWLKPENRRFDSNEMSLTQTIAEARRFVLDEPMAAFLADLAYAPLLGSNIDRTGRFSASSRRLRRASEVMESLRRCARLPHRLTWIEFPMAPRMHRAVSEYGAVIDLRPESRPDTNGWLCVQNPQIDTAFMAIEATSHSFNEHAREPTPHCNPLAYQWRADDGGTLPWESYLVDLPEMDFSTPAAWLSGISSYNSDMVSFVRSPHIRRGFLDSYIRNSTYNPVTEYASDIRYLWALLACINDIPVSVSEVHAAKGYVARGRYRKFLDHKVIHLHVPEKRYRRAALQVMAGAKRRAHMVRGFWRVDWRNPPRDDCEHRWIADAKHMLCEKCEGVRIWVHEHQRGDASLGLVTHDYKVERGERDHAV